MSEKLSFSYFDEFETKRHVFYKLHEYNNLMELLFDKKAEEWGDCKGRAWCGTCRIKIISGTLKEPKSIEETQTLSKINAVEIDPAESKTLETQDRLACQIPINSDLNNILFKIISD